MSRVLMVFTSHDTLGDTGEPTGYTVPEAAHPWREFRDAGVEVDFVSTAGGEPPQDGFEEDDPVQREFLDAEHDRLAAMPKAEDVDPGRYDAIFFVGGHGTMWDFPDSRPLQQAAAEIWERGGVVSSVCHGPAAFVNLKLSDGSYLIEGKRLNSFTNEEEAAVDRVDAVPFLLQTRLEERGANWEGGERFGEFTVTDGRLITGQNPASAGPTARLVAEAIN